MQNGELHDNERLDCLCARSESLLAAQVRCARRCDEIVGTIEASSSVLPGLQGRPASHQSHTQSTGSSGHICAPSRADGASESPEYHTTAQLCIPPATLSLPVGAQHLQNRILGGAYDAAAEAHHKVQNDVLSRDGGSRSMASQALPGRWGCYKSRAA